VESLMNIGRCRERRSSFNPGVSTWASKRGTSGRSKKKEGGRVERNFGEKGCIPRLQKFRHDGKKRGEGPPKESSKKLAKGRNGVKTKEWSASAKQ